MSSEFKSARFHERHIRYVCEGDGTPAVVIDQGQGLSIERGFECSSPIGWARVFKEVQKSTRIIMHDRAGLGSSEPAPGPRTSIEMVRDLRAVLTAAQVRPPCVLVGHSVGGFNVRLFAGRYPDEVAGMVLVESSHLDQLTKFASVLPPETPEESTPLKALRRGPEAALSAEAFDFRACAEQVRGITTIGLKPLVIVSQSPQALGPPGIPLLVWEKMRTIWSDLQAELLELSGLGTRVIAAHAGHQIQVEEPDLVVEAILSVVRDVRVGVRRMH
ncbi:MAG: alpha/beta fold hydrolase [Steroidobacteraceae bacterium]